MKSIPIKLPAFLLSLIFMLPLSSLGAEELPPFGIDDPIAPLSGSLVLAGSEVPAPQTREAFIQILNNQGGKLLVIGTNRGAKNVSIWKEMREEANLKTFELALDAKTIDPALISAFKQADGVWLASDYSKLANKELKTELGKILDKGGVVGAGARAAETLGEAIEADSELKPAFSLFPKSIVRTGDFDDQNNNQATASVIWEIPPTATLIVHSGRRVGVIGKAGVTARIPAQNGWPERVETLRPPEVRIPYSADLFSWTRSAQAREGEVFPPEEPVAPELESGTLIIIGGGGSTEDMWTTFVEEAGGVDANFVAIIQKEGPFPAEKLRKMGCKNITVLLSDIELREKANHDEEFLAALKNADGIFFGGGRTYRFMDAYQNTTAHRLMLDVLDRGGVIAGTSAGAQIQGDFLVRGDPRTNQTIWAKGNDVGLSFLRGVIIDVHFQDRGREKTSPALFKQHPQMLGIGIDEATAIVVRGTTAEVLGRGSVGFYDMTKEGLAANPEPIFAKAGQSYDIKKRAPIQKRSRLDINKK